MGSCLATSPKHILLCSRVGTVCSLGVVQTSAMAAGAWTGLLKMIGTTLRFFFASRLQCVRAGHFWRNGTVCPAPRVHSCQNPVPFPSLLASPVFQGVSRPTKVLQNAFFAVLDTFNLLQDVHRVWRVKQALSKCSLDQPIVLRVNLARSRAMNRRPSAFYARLDQARAILGQLPACHAITGRNSAAEETPSARRVDSLPGAFRSAHCHQRPPTHQGPSGSP